MYSASVISQVLGVGLRSLFYKPKKAKDESELYSQVETVFRTSGSSFGRRQIKKHLKQENAEMIISERKVSKVMRLLGLTSAYIKNRKKKPKPNKKVNDSEAANLLQGRFSGWKRNEVVLSDLTYINISSRWHYFCPLLELSRRMVIGHSVGKAKTSGLVREAFYSAEIDLREIDIFHTDRGGEFIGEEIESLLKAMNIKHSLSAKGTPTDNAPMESFFKTLKVEFIQDRVFTSLKEFKQELSDWLYWYNHKRLHSSLDYQTPVMKEASDAPPA